MYVGRDESFSAALASRRKPSQDTTRRSNEHDGVFGRKPSQSTRNTSDSTLGTSQPPAHSTTATSSIIVPNKSTIEEEYIDIPYGREGRDSGFGERNGNGTGVDDAPDSASDYPSPISTRSPPAGLGGLAARLRREDDDDDIPPANTSGDDPFDKYSRTIGESSRSLTEGAVHASRVVGGRTSVTEDTEKLKSEYEYKISTMQSQISDLRRDLGHAAEAEKSYRESEKRIKQLEEELAGVRQVRFSFVSEPCRFC